MDALKRNARNVGECYVFWFRGKLDVDEISSRKVYVR